MFDRTHCTTMTGQELEGKVLVMSPYTLKESYWAPENQLWLASGGFGCSPTAAGRAVYATCLGDGEHARWNREDFIGILEEQHIPLLQTGRHGHVRVTWPLSGDRDVPLLDWDTARPVRP